ncbi:YcnI family copper-binding membrane protein [Aeromicrobium sp.]|uniref:YcnI family copper-binding membrane protein n=1 Tax=Aeromicrobium sp. TaxID=1871063 RepID=UPI003D6BAF26
MSRNLARLGAALITAALILSASPASAHVTVSSSDAAAGGFGKVVFRVPSESETAATTKIRITLPEDTPFAFVSAQTKPGWKLDVKEADLADPITVHGTTLSKAVRTVTWTTSGDGIAPGEFDEFALSAGPFPKVRTMSFSAEQTYDDGEVVPWDEPTKKGAEEPEHPAPTLELAAPEVVKSAATESDDTLARTMSGVALVTAVVALFLALRQNRRRA